MYTKDIIATCKDNQDKYSRFKRYNTPAKVCTLLAVLIPLVILVPTSSSDSKGQLDITTSPYASYGGIIFLVGASLAIIFSQLAKKYKITMPERLALYTFNTYENMSEFNRGSTVKNYKNEAEKSLVTLIREIKTTTKEADEKIRWILPFLSSIRKLPPHLEENLLSNMTSNNQDVIEEIKKYMVKLMTYFLNPSEILLKELLLQTFPQTNNHQEVLNKNSIISVRPSRKVWIFIAMSGMGGAVYFLALAMGIDKNTAFLAGITLAGTIIAGYIAYLRK